MKRSSMQLGLRIGLASALIVAMIGGLASCAGDQRVVGLNEFPAYPGEKLQSEVLNIQAIRDADAISLTNTTAQRFETTRVWLNQEFSYVVDGIDVGETIRIDLHEFRNRYGARFRAGGFFATQRPKNVVLAQFETDPDSQSLLGLVVVNGRVSR